jgi:hypothetical protein
MQLAAKKQIPDVAADAVGAAVGGPNAVYPAIAGHAFPGIVHFRHARPQRDRIAAQKGHPVEFQVECGGLMADAQPHAGGPLHASRHHAPRRQDGLAVQHYGRDQNGADRTACPARVRTHRGRQPDVDFGSGRRLADNMRLNRKQQKRENEHRGL